MWHLDDIGIFVTVVEQGSFVQAATRLEMPTSTVSRRVSELEAALEMKLLERTSRRLRVTERGQQLFDQCLPHVKEMRHQIDLLSKSRNQLSGKITLTAPTHLGNAVLAPWLCEFLADNRDIELELQLSNQIEDLIDKGIDLAIRIGPLKDSQFVAQYLFTPHYGLYASPRYLASQPPINTPDDLSRHDVIAMAHQKARLTLIDPGGHEQTINTTTRLRCDDIDMARQTASNGLSIACLPRLSVQRAVDSGELVRVLDQYEINPGRDVYAVYPSRKHLSAKTRHLIDFLKEAAARTV